VINQDNNAPKEGVGQSDKKREAVHNPKLIISGKASERANLSGSIGGISHQGKQR